MYIIGINAYHADSSACILKDGKLITAVEEERFTRIKHFAGFPKKSIEHCLETCKINLSDVNYFAINRDPKANNLKRFFYVLKKRPSISLLFDRLKNRKKYQSIKKTLDQEFPDDKFKGDVINIEHHLAHLSSCFHVSPFEEACVLSVDGFGDFASSAWGYGKNNDIKIDKKIHFPHSLGIFYQSITQYLGFKNYGDEYKIMGLAPYGKPEYLDKLKKILILKPNGEFELNLKYFKFHKSNFNYTWNSGTVSIDDLYSNEMEVLLGKSRTKDEELTDFHKDIAHSTQKIYEEAFLNIVNTLYNKYKSKNLCIAGGCGMNSVANGKVKKLTNFENVYIQPAAGDAGGAIGSAFSTYHNILKQPKSFVMKHAYWGNSYSEDYIKSLLEKNKFKLDKNFEVKKIHDQSELSKDVASEIADGKVVGWFQGKMEWGPRALGNRSILGDPRRKDMKDILNLKIKRRESFRPFAPSILSENVDKWFEIDDKVPFMMKVYQIKEDKRSIIPAVTHVDGSGRLQTVSSEINNKYYSLINEFFKLTKVPILLNTSFNENEPIVCKPEEALDCFLRTKMDLLVLENILIKRI